jgi:hypothetical protein
MASRILIFGVAVTVEAFTPVIVVRFGRIRCRSKPVYQFWSTLWHLEILGDLILAEGNFASPELLLCCLNQFLASLPKDAVTTVGSVLVYPIVMVTECQEVWLEVVEELQSLNEVITDPISFLLLACSSTQRGEIPQVTEMNAVVWLPCGSEIKQHFFRIVADQRTVVVCCNKKLFVFAHLSVITNWQQISSKSV